MLTKTSALITAIIPYSDSSQIYRAFSPELGAFSLIAKGILKKESGLCRLVEYDLALYPPREEGLFLLKESRETRDYSHFPSTSTWVAADAGLEFLNCLLIPEDEAPQYYALLISYLSYLQNVSQNAVFILWRLMLRVYQMLGIGLEIHRCAACHSQCFPKGFDASGRLFCTNCLPQVKPWLFSPLAGEILALLPEIANHLDAFKPDRGVISEINELFSAYFFAHHKKTLKLKSLSVLSQFYPLPKKA